MNKLIANFMASSLAIAAWMSPVPAKAYKADQEALVIMSDMVAIAVGVEMFCGGYSANMPFFKQMAGDLGMDKQDVDAAMAIVSGKEDEIRAAINKTGKEKWCSRSESVMLKKTNGMSPITPNEGQ